MKAMVYERYGGPEVLHLAEIERPAPGPGEVLVKVVAAGVATGDRHLLRGEPFLVRLMFGLRRPKLRVLGSDVAGVVEEVGAGVGTFHVGDEVIGHLSEAGFGTFAEYVVAPEEALVPKPAGLSFEEAGSLLGSALPALQGLRDKGGLAEGKRVLLNGASGGVGTFAVQIAKAFGAEVTGVCSTRNVELVRELGADRVIDYTQEDFRKGADRWDMVLDAAAFRPVRETLRAVEKGGTYVFVGGASGPTMQAMLLGPLYSMLTGKKVAFFVAAPRPEDMLLLKDMAEAGKLKPVLDRRFPLAELPDAVRHLESKASRGKTVIQVGALTGPDRSPPPPPSEPPDPDAGTSHPAPPGRPHPR